MTSNEINLIWADDQKGSGWIKENTELTSGSKEAPVFPRHGVVGGALTKCLLRQIIRTLIPSGIITTPLPTSAAPHTVERHVVMAVLLCSKKQESMPVHATMTDFHLARESFSQVITAVWSMSQLFQLKVATNLRTGARNTTAKSSCLS